MQIRMIYYNSKVINTILYIFSNRYGLISSFFNVVLSMLYGAYLNLTQFPCDCPGSDFVWSQNGAAL